MLRSKKVVSSLVLTVLAVGSFWFCSQPVTGATGTGKSVSCVIDMVVETSVNNGAPVSTTYHKAFTLREGEFLSDDFSNALRFRIFDAHLTRVNNEWVMAVDWFADTTVFDSVDLSTAVVIANGQKNAKSIGTHSFFTSNNTVTATNFSIVCVAN